MKEPTITHSTFVIERSFARTPDRVFAALADPAKKRRWFAEEKGLALEEFKMDFRVGGTELARYRFQAGTPFPGTALMNETVYLDIVPDRRVVIGYTMTLGEKRISASLSTFELVPTATGTDLIFTDQGAYFEGADGPKMRQEGWSVILDNLAKELAG